jgi:hypothetical protein
MKMFRCKEAKKQR